MRFFTYERATSAEDALAKAVRTPNAKFIAGGTNLLDLMKLEIETPAHLVDLNSFGLKTIEPTQNGGLRIGALVSNTALAADERVRRDYGVLSRALLAGAASAAIDVLLVDERGMDALGGAGMAGLVRAATAAKAATALQQTARSAAAGAAGLGGAAGQHAAEAARREQEELRGVLAAAEQAMARAQHCRDEIQAMLREHGAEAVQRR